MIGTVDVNIQAANPKFPLTPLRAFVNSPSSIRVRNVPKKIGKWDVTAVLFSANYPDNTIKSAECVLIGGVWVGTIDGSSSVGSSLNGYQVTANGTDEKGGEITGYILGKGDVEILDADGTITPGTTTHYIHVLPSIPANPKYGDAYTDAGTWKVYNGTAWVVLGGISAAGQYVQAPVAEGGDGKWHRVIISDGTLAYDSTGVDEPPASASQSWVLGKIADEATARNTAITTAVGVEAALRIGADNELENAIDAEEIARESADNAEVTARNTAITNAVSAEASSRQSADSALEYAIDAEEAARIAAIASEASARATAISTAVNAEAAARESADDALEAAIDAEENARANAVTAEATARADAITAEATARANGDSTNASAIQDEASLRASGDSTNATAIEAEATARSNAIGAEATARQTADQANATAITAEAARAQAAEASLDADIDQEATARAAADSAEAAARAAADSAEAAARAAADATKVSLTGDEAVGGVKTFASSPIVPTQPDADDSTKISTTAWVRSRIANWWSSAYETVKSYVDNKVSAHTSLTNNPHAVTKSQVGLGNCNNTSDENKPISTATQTALNVKADDSAVVHTTGDESINGSKAFWSDITNIRNGNSANVRARFNGVARGEAPDAQKTFSTSVEDENGAQLVSINQFWSTANNRVIQFNATNDDGTNTRIARFTSSNDGSTVKADGASLAATCMPSTSYTDNVIAIENGATYTAASSGYLTIRAYVTSSGNGELRLAGTSGICMSDHSSTAGQLMCVFLPVKKGGTVTLYCSNATTGQYSLARFIKADAEV